MRRCLALFCIAFAFLAVASVSYAAPVDPATPVPEPSGLLALLAGIGGLMGYISRRMES